jgi:F0F1-type ATP synthase membrane subunit c/vacuolar-type H+-ATPase subunit K
MSIDAALALMMLTGLATGYVFGRIAGRQIERAEQDRRAARRRTHQHNNNTRRTQP